jgi:hypothetical protein
VEPVGEAAGALVAADTLIVVGPGTAEFAAHADVTTWSLRG